MRRSSQAKRFVPFFLPVNTFDFGCCSTWLGNLKQKRKGLIRSTDSINTSECYFHRKSEFDGSDKRNNSSDKAGERKSAQKQQVFFICGLPPKSWEFGLFAFAARPCHYFRVLSSWRSSSFTLIKLIKLITITTLNAGAIVAPKRYRAVCALAATNYLCCMRP